MVSIHRPLGYGPSTLPLRHSAYGNTQYNLKLYKSGSGRYYVEIYMFMVLTMLLVTPRLCSEGPNYRCPINASYALEASVSLAQPRRVNSMYKTFDNLCVKFIQVSEK